jgi:peroxiredoxin
MKTIYHRLLAAGLLAMCGTLPTHAEKLAVPVPPTTNAAQVEAKADAVLTRMDAFYRGLKSLKLDLEVQLHMEAEGMKQEITSTWGVALQRPNQLAILHKLGQNQFTFVCDGRKTFVHIPATKRYLEKPAPPSLDVFFAEQSEAALLLQQGVPFFALLIAPNPRARLLEEVAAVTYAGVEMWQGAECHKLHGAQKQFDWDLWIESGKQPLVRKVVMDMGKTAQAMADRAPQMKAARWQIEIQFNQVELGPTLADDAFAFTPPASAKKVDSFRPQPNEEEGPHPLLGKPAPNFELDQLDGPKLTLAKHKGQAVVLLDFWATWCGPCRKSLPVLADVAAKFKDQGLVFYAINQREKAETIRDFLANQSFKLPVALDSEGKVGGDYGVEGIPQTVLIARDGRVQAVHVGYDPAQKDTLTKQIEDLLAGKSLLPAK